MSLKSQKIEELKAELNQMNSKADTSKKHLQDEIAILHDEIKTLNDDKSSLESKLTLLKQMSEKYLTEQKDEFNGLLNKLQLDLDKKD